MHAATQHSPFSLSPYFPLGPTEEQVLVLSQVAIAGAVLPGGRRGVRRAAASHLSLLESLPNFDLDDYLDACSSGRVGWQMVLADAAEAITDESNLLIVAIEICTNPLLYGEEAHLGILRRRIDAVLDVLESQFSCVDVQQTFDDIMAELTGVASGSGWRNIMDSPAADVVIGIHPLIGLPAKFALGKLMATDAEPAPSQGGTLVGLTRAVQICRYAYRDEEQQNAAVGLRGQILDGWSIADVSAEGRFTANVLTALSELAGVADGDTAVPDTTGMRLSDAIRILQAFKVSPSMEDDLKPGGAARTPWQEDNWIVVSQTLQEAGSSAQLMIRKRTDPQA